MDMEKPEAERLVVKLKQQAMPRKSKTKRGGFLMEKLVLRVPTIKCEGCVQNIERVLKQRKGVTAVEGDPETKKVTVSYLQEQINEGEIRGAIVQMGHQLG